MERFKKSLKIFWRNISKNLFFFYLFNFASEEKIINFGENHSRIKICRLLIVNCKKLSAKQKLAIAFKNDCPYLFDLVILDQKISLTEIFDFIKKMNPVYSWEDLIVKRPDFNSFIKKINKSDALIFLREIDSFILKRIVFKERIDLRRMIVDLKLRRAYL